MSDLRRSAARMPVEWVGRLRLQGDPEGRWRACRIVDLSPGGAGVELPDLSTEPPGSVPVELQIVMVGQLRHRSAGSSSAAVRAGIRLDYVTGEPDPERELLDEA